MDKDGNFVKAASKESHIPLEEFEFKLEFSLPEFKQN
jgi:hypothetical protein